MLICENYVLKNNITSSQFFRRRSCQCHPFFIIGQSLCRYVHILHCDHDCMILYYINKWIALLHVDNNDMNFIMISPTCMYVCGLMTTELDSRDMLLYSFFYKCLILCIFKKLSARFLSREFTRYITL